MGKRFPYYARLSAAEKRTYRKSDEITAVALPDAALLAPLVADLEVQLSSGKRARVRKAANAFTDALFCALGVESVRVRVREVRPDLGGSELHGQYTYATEGDSPVIEIWMRTGAREQIVKFRTFLRTLLHEVAHHLDVSLYELPESFHTEGFFRRESSLMRQLCPPEDKPARAEPKARRSAQLALFDFTLPEP